jgi:hypothetical protein
MKRTRMMARVAVAVGMRSMLLARGAPESIARDCFHQQGYNHLQDARAASGGDLASGSLAMNVTGGPDTAAASPACWPAPEGSEASG